MKKWRLTIYLFIVAAFCLSLAYSFRQMEVKGPYSYFIVIDPGHGGKDNGSCYDKVVEDEINLAIGEKLLEMLLCHDQMAMMTRTGDYDLASQYAKNRKREDLKKRVEMINQSHANVFISIHMNIYEKSPSVKGPMVYYNGKNAASYDLAGFVNKELGELSKLDKPLHQGDFYLFHKTTIPGILIECGFLSNEEERNQLCSSSYQKEVAKAIYKGVLNYLESN